MSSMHEVGCRFWVNVEIGSKEDCWPWKGTLFVDGYGRFNLKHPDGGWRSLRAHRVAYFLAHRSIEKKLLVIHSCDTPVCCNPAHLRQGTHQDNSDDKFSRDRQHSKLTRSAVKQSRELHGKGWTIYQLAEKFDVSSDAILEALKGKSWRHLPGGSDYVRHRAKGSAHGMAKLSERDARRILELGASGAFIQKQIADMFGVSRATVSDILRRKKWRYVSADGLIFESYRPQGSKNPRAKLLEKQVHEIRESHALGGVTYAELGRRYGISAASVSAIIRRVNWNHI